MERRTTLFQTVVVSNRAWVDGLEVGAQAPKDLRAEAAYLKATAQERHDRMAQAQQRLLELLRYYRHRLEYRKRTGMAVEIGRPLETEGPVPEAPSTGY